MITNCGSESFPPARLSTSTDLHKEASPSSASQLPHHNRTTRAGPVLLTLARRPQSCLFDHFHYFFELLPTYSRSSAILNNVPEYKHTLCFLPSLLQHTRRAIFAQPPPRVSNVHHITQTQPYFGIDLKLSSFRLLSVYFAHPTSHHRHSTHRAPLVRSTTRQRRITPSSFWSTATCSCHQASSPLHRGQLRLRHDSSVYRSSGSLISYAPRRCRSSAPALLCCPRSGLLHIAVDLVLRTSHHRPSTSPPCRVLLSF